MAPKPLRTLDAKRSLKLLAATRGEGKSPCAFAIGKPKKEAKDKFVVVLTRGKPAKARTLAGRDYAWQGKTQFAPKNATIECDVLATGLAKLNDGELTLEFSKGTFKNFKRASKEFFKNGFGLPPIWRTILIKDLTPAAEAAYSELDDDKLDLDAEVPDFEQLQAEFQDLDPDSIIETNESEVEAGAQPAAEPVASAAAEPQEADDPDDEDAPQSSQVDAAKNALSPELRAEVAARARELGQHIVDLAASIGLPPGSAAADVAAKIEGWLAVILASVPEAERAAKLENFLARLQLALCSVDALRDVRHANKVEKPGRPDGKIGENLDLNDIEMDDLKVEEVVDALFDFAKKSGIDRALPYDFSKASFEKIDQIVRSRWPQDEGAAKREIVERLIATLRTQCGIDAWLIQTLGLRGYPLAAGTAAEGAAEGTDMAADDSILETAVTAWSAAVSGAEGDLNELKAIVERELSSVDETWKIGMPPLGGSWAEADAELAKVVAASPASAILAVRGTMGPGRQKAIDTAAAELDKVDAMIRGSNIFHLLASAPIGKGAYVAPQLADGVRGLRVALDKAREAGSVSVAAE